MVTEGQGCIPTTFPAGLGAVFGKSFVGGDVPGVTYSKERCADLFEHEPVASTCEQAATALEPIGGVNPSDASG